jgi:hypothetical protein
MVDQTEIQDSDYIEYLSLGVKKRRDFKSALTKEQWAFWGKGLKKFKKRGGISGKPVRLSINPILNDEVKAHFEIKSPVSSMTIKLQINKTILVHRWTIKSANKRIMEDSLGLNDFDFTQPRLPTDVSSFMVAAGRGLGEMIASLK